MGTIVNSQHLVLAGNGAGVVHDATLSGYGTFDSPLGALFPEVSHDSTLSGNGLTTPLTVNFPTIQHDNTISGNGYTEPLGALIPNTAVVSDNSLTGNGTVSSPLGVSSELSLTKLTLGNTVVSSNKIQMMDSSGAVTVTPEQIRDWDSKTTNLYVNTDNLSGNGSNALPLGIKNWATIPGSYGTACISNNNIYLSGQNSAQAKLALTNYGSTPYLELSTSGETATMDIDDINRVKECLTIKHDYDMWGSEFNRNFSALTAHNGATLVDKSAVRDVSPVQSNDIYYPTKYYENDYMIYTTMPIYRNGGADMHYTMYNESGVYDSGSKYLLGAETHTHHTYSMNIRTKNFQQPWAGLTTFGLKDYVNSYTFIMPSNWIFESGWIEFKDASGESNYLPCYSGCWYTVGKEYAAESNSNYYTWKLLNSGVNIFLDSNQP